MLGTSESNEDPRACLRAENRVDGEPRGSRNLRLLARFYGTVVVATVTPHVTVAVVSTVPFSWVVYGACQWMSTM